MAFTYRDVVRAVGTELGIPEDAPMPDGTWVTIMHPDLFKWWQRAERVLDELIRRYGGIKGDRYWRRWLRAEMRKID